MVMVMVVLVVVVVVFFVLVVMFVTGKQFDPRARVRDRCIQLRSTTRSARASDRRLAGDS